MHNISPDFRLWVSTQGNVKYAPIVHEDASTFRKYIMLSGRPVFLDSLVLSLYGDSELNSHHTEISYGDGDTSNISIDNLSWNNKHKKTAGNYQHTQKNKEEDVRLESMTITPEMIRDERFPILEQSVRQNSSIQDDTTGSDNRIDNETKLSVLESSQYNEIMSKLSNIESMVINFFDFDTLS